MASCSHSAGLADARLADHHDQAALAGERRVEGLFELRSSASRPTKVWRYERGAGSIAGGSRIRCRHATSAGLGSIALSAWSTSPAEAGRLSGILLQQAQDQRFQARRALGPVPGGCDGRGIEMLA